MVRRLKMGDLRLKRFAVLAFLWVTGAIVLVRSVGVAARYVRDQMLEHMLVTSLRALGDAKVVAFLDWSSLLGLWREGGVLEDEEDVDIGVILPTENGLDIHAAQQVVVSAVKSAFAGVSVVAHTSLPLAGNIFYVLSLCMFRSALHNPL
jgi:hypothetical protein